MKVPPADLGERLLAQSELILRPSDPPKLEELARLLGVSRATLYYYFAGRDDLVAFVLLRHVEGGAAEIDAADPGEGPFLDRLHAVVRAVVDHLAERPHTCLGLLGAAASAGRMGEVLQLNDRLIVSRVRELLADGVAEGALDIGDVDLAADALLGGVMMAIVGSTYRLAPGEASLGPEARAALVEQVARGLRR